jgi:hypothetical protein
MMTGVVAVTVGRGYALGQRLAPRYDAPDALRPGGGGLLLLPIRAAGATARYSGLSSRLARAAGARRGLARRFDSSSLSSQCVIGKATKTVE